MPHRPALRQPPIPSTFVYRPCRGGLSLADADFDGEFEIYMGDRASGYPHAEGLRCWNAHTLEPLWERPDIYHSSGLPVIADVTGDSDLEIVAEDQSRGCAVLNGMTGETIPGFNYLNWKRSHFIIFNKFKPF